MTTIEKVAEFSIVTIGFAKVTVKNPETALTQLRSSLGEEVQIVRADRVAGKEHLNLAASHVSRAIQQGHRRSKSVAMELLLYISGQRQITKAIQMVGVTSKTRELIVIHCVKRPEEVDERKVEMACVDLFGGVRRDSVVEIESVHKIRELCTAFEITDLEFDAAKIPDEDPKQTLKRLVVERSALLAIE